jgi:hypothetical protein
MGKAAARRALGGPLQTSKRTGYVSVRVARPAGGMTDILLGLAIAIAAMLVLHRVILGSWW